MRKNSGRITRYTAAGATFVALAVPALMTGCEQIAAAQDALCCTSDEFQVGGTVTIEGNAEAGVAVQAVADFSGIAAASIDDLTTACRTISEDLDAPKASRDAAEQNPDKRAKMNAYCDLAVAAIGTFKAQAGGTISLTVTPPVCEVSVSAKADCQAKCSGSASCDVVANPPTCEGGKLEIACKGGCTGMAGASVSCEGSCSGSCSGSCTAMGGVDCAGKCEGTCSAGAAGSGIQADGTCQGTCSGTCSATPPSVTCSGTCNGSCDATCQGSATASVKCDGTCDAEYEPVKCTGGELSGGCEASVECDANCDASVSAKAECKPPAIALTFSGSADIEAAGKLKLVLEANLGLVAAIAGRIEVMGNIVATFSGNINEETLAEITPACIPVVIAAIGEAVADVEASGSATVSVMGSI